MPPRESGSLEVTSPREFIVHDGFPTAFRGALLWGPSLALSPLFPVELTVGWKVRRGQQRR